jgi:hypothetical protein
MVEMIIALRRQMLAQGTTRLEAAEILHRALQSLPEPGCLGDYTDFLTYNREENRTGEFAIKKKLLLHHQTRVAQYLVTLNCFNCQCGRSLNEHVRDQTVDLYLLCPRCLATPYCDTICASRFQPLHALVCNTHPAWESDAGHPINFFAYVPLITRATHTQKILPPYPPVFQLSPNTFGDTSIAIMKGTEAFWSKEGRI